MREFAILLLDDEHGISVDAWNILNFLLIDEKENVDRDNDDIIQAVKCTEGRVYLPEGWNENNET